MITIAVLSGIIFVLAPLCFLGLKNPKIIWYCSVMSHGYLILLQLILAAIFFKNGKLFTLASKDLISTQDGFFGPTQFISMDFFGAILGLFYSICTLTLLLFSRRLFKENKFTLPSLSVYSACFFACLGANNLVAVAVFIGAMAIAKMVWLSQINGDGGMKGKDSFFIEMFSIFGLLTSFIVFSQLFAGDSNSWFIIDGFSTYVESGILGFYLLFFSILAMGGIFPFHSKYRTYLYGNETEKLLPVFFQPVLSMLVMFKFLPMYFLNELRSQGGAVILFFSVVCVICFFGFIGAKEKKLKIFWLQQGFLAISVQGFFSLTQRGWVGSVVLAAVQCLVVVFSLMLPTGLERTYGNEGGTKLTKLTMFLLRLVPSLNLITFPLSLSFYGVVMIFVALRSVGAIYTVGLTLGLVLLCFGSLEVLLFGRTMAEIESPALEVKTGKMVLSALPLLLFLIILGLIPSLVVEPFGLVMNSMGSVYSIGF